MKQPTPEFYSDVLKDGTTKMAPTERAAMLRWISTFKPGTRLQHTIKKKGSKRSNDQNRYYWGTVVSILADHFGYDPEEMHEELKYIFNPIQSKIDPARKIGGSTTKLDTVEFYSSDEKSYIERICRWASSEHGVYIPPPKKLE